MTIGGASGPDQPPIYDAPEGLDSMDVPDLYAVFADEKRLELIAAFPTLEEATAWAETCARDFKRRYVVGCYPVGTIEWLAEPTAAAKPAGGDVSDRPGVPLPAVKRPVGAAGAKSRGGRGCVQRDDDRLAGRQLPPVDTGGTNGGGVCPAKGPAVQRDADPERKAV